jgi:hypothetical protein
MYARCGPQRVSKTSTLVVERRSFGRSIVEPLVTHHYTRPEAKKKPTLHAWISAWVSTGGGGLAFAPPKVYIRLTLRVHATYSTYIARLHASLAAARACYRAARSLHLSPIRNPCQQKRRMIRHPRNSMERTKNAPLRVETASARGNGEPGSGWRAKRSIGKTCRVML